jgi:HAD superfamily hydrolase (TIGR01459 family)
MSAAIATFDRFSVLAPRYDVLLCDIWGVVHNGVRAHGAACEALTCFRAGGGTVILITNAPRPAAWVIGQLDTLGVARNAYDGVTTSGDVTRQVMAGRSGSAVLHIGPQRDISIFDGLDIGFAPVEGAEYAVCTGLFDDTTETPDAYRDLLARMRRRDMFMLCANPDLVVERGDAMVYCAGAIADLYVALGGEALYAGKPHRPIYDLALAKATDARGATPPARRTLAIGDSLRTDITGALALGIDGLFVSGGIHAEELGSRDIPSRAAMTAAFAAAGVTPHAVMPRLVW